MINKFNGAQKKYFSDVETILSSSIFLDDRFLEEASSIEIEKNYVTPELHNYGDEVNKYLLNSYGHRSIEFKNVPLITAGCSMTFGVGVPYDGIWSTILSDKLKMNHVNLAIPGWSIEAIVDNLFKYFYKYGNPEKLAVLFPDYNRTVLTSYKGFSEVQPHDVEEPKVKIIKAILMDESANEKVKYSKKPHNLLNFLTPEYALYKSLTAINRLVIYCKNSNIDFAWSTWDYETDALLKICREVWNQQIWDGYVSVDLGNDLHSRGCHEEYSKKYKENFYDGLDKSSLNLTSHPGVHQHIHYADELTRKLKN
jgi:hypothetical protein